MGTGEWFGCKSLVLHSSGCVQKPGFALLFRAQNVTDHVFRDWVSLMKCTAFCYKFNDPTVRCSAGGSESCDPVHGYSSQSKTLPLHFETKLGPLWAFLEKQCQELAAAWTALLHISPIPTAREMCPWGFAFSLLSLQHWVLGGISCSLQVCKQLEIHWAQDRKKKKEREGEKKKRKSMPVAENIGQEGNQANCSWQRKFGEQNAEKKSSWRREKRRGSRGTKVCKYRRSWCHFLRWQVLTQRTRIGRETRSKNKGILKSSLLTVQRRG